MPNKMPTPPSEDTKRATSGSPLSYNSYLKVEELKHLQILQSNPPHHDELLFIVIHQAYELWFKQILHECDMAMSLLEEGRAIKANFYLRRVVAILKLLVQQIHILETMSAKDFLGFRYNLNPASGFQSSQFRELEFVCGLKDERILTHFQADPTAQTKLLQRLNAPCLAKAFYRLLQARGFNVASGSNQNADAKRGAATGASTDTESEQLAEGMRIRELLKIYNDPESNNDLYELCETLFDIDELIYLWRMHHVTVVERMIGFKRGTGGSDGVAYLRSTMTKRCFPDLWQLRTYLEQ